jgi:hypothetical protein
LLNLFSFMMLLLKHVWFNIFLIVRNKLLHANENIVDTQMLAIQLAQFLKPFYTIVDMR